MEHRPYRHRHDGWTPARITEFLHALRDTRSITDACRHVGLSRTSARRAYRRMPEFAAAWDHALALGQPALEKAAYTRAVEGWDEPIVYRGVIVGYRRRYSDAMLKLLMQRETARVEVKAPRQPPPLSPDELRETILTRVKVIERHRVAEERAKALEWADDMARRGWAP